MYLLEPLFLLYTAVCAQPLLATTFPVIYVMFGIGGGLLGLVCLMRGPALLSPLALGLFCGFGGIVYLFFSTPYIWQFFIYYELFFIISFFLVFHTSQNRRSVFASIYFFLWTQGGSLFVLLGFLGLLFEHPTTMFNEMFVIMETLPSLWREGIGFCLLLGFNIKLPIWPFYFWLTKVHVEAPTFFSVYLSGFLVKTAVYGIYLVINMSGWLYIYYLFLGLHVFSIIDATIKMLYQADLKKIVAFATVQEMNRLMLFFYILTPVMQWGGLLFCFVHCLLSSLFFYLVDILYRVYRTRHIHQISGLWAVAPGFSLYLVSSVLIYIGLPCSFKFILELKLLGLCFQWHLCFGVFMVGVVQCGASVIWAYLWFQLLYGTPRIEKVWTMSLTEMVVCLICLSGLICGV